MDVPLASPLPARRHRTVAVVALVVVVGVLVIAAAAGLVWIRSYAPLVIPAFGWGKDLRMVTGDGGGSGDQVALLGSRPASVELDFGMQGRWPITIESIATSPAPPYGPAISIPLVRLSAPDLKTLARYTGASMSLRLSRQNDGQRVFVSFRADCRGAVPRTYSTATKLAIRYRYLHFFSRTVLMDAPFPLATACGAP